MADEPTQEHQAVEHRERLVVWLEQDGWHWRITTTGRRITGKADLLTSAVDDALRVALAHGMS